MKASVRLTVFAFAAILAGCARQPPHPMGLSRPMLSAQTERMGVIMTAVPKTDTRFPGASCLLCLAAANTAHMSLTSHVQTLPRDDLQKLKEDMANLVRKNGLPATVIEEDVNLETLADAQGVGRGREISAAKDYTPLKAKYKVDRLLVIDITALGISRPYSAYVPTGLPTAILEGRGYIVNLNDNTYEWYHPVRIYKTAEGNWDEPPKFPGLTNAYFHVLELGMDDFKKPFTR